VSSSVLEEDVMAFLRTSSRECCCCSADSDTSEGREKVTDERTESLESTRDRGNVEFSGELDTVWAVTAVVGLADGKGIPRMVAADVVDGLRLLLLSSELLVNLPISDSEGKVGRGGGMARDGSGFWRPAGTPRAAGVGEGSYSRERSTISDEIL